jgi:hypothetical protein
MDPLHFCIAIVPVAVYLLLIGSINLSGRPFVTTGVRDLCALAIAVSGFMIAGPMELFLPEAVASILGGWVWLPLVALYALLVTLAVLLMRPRLVIYNMTQDQLRPILSQVLGELDAEARWAGDVVVLPKLGVQLATEAYPGMRNVALVSIGTTQNLAGWQRLRVYLQSEFSTVKSSVNTQGFSFLMLSIVMIAAVIFSLLTGKQQIAQAFREMLRL